MKLNEIRIVEYTEKEEKLNCVSHAAGIVLSALILLNCVIPAFHAKDGLRMLCAILYLFGTTAMFITSVLYHAAKPGKSKKILRVLDHCMVFFAVSGTATGCVPAVYDNVSKTAAVVMLCAAWGGAAAGLIVSFIGFESLKGIKLTVYILTALVCAVCGCKAYFVLPIGAFLAFLGGSTLLIAGIIIYGLGRTRRFLHSVFHFFVLGGLFVYWLGIAEYCY